MRVNKVKSIVDGKRPKDQVNQDVSVVSLVPQLVYHSSL